MKPRNASSFPDRFVLLFYLYAFAAATRNFLTELWSDRVSANKAIYAPSLHFYLQHIRPLSLTRQVLPMLSLIKDNEKSNRTRRNTTLNPDGRNFTGEVGLQISYHPFPDFLDCRPLSDPSEGLTRDRRRVENDDEILGSERGIGAADVLPLVALHCCNNFVHS